MRYAAIEAGGTKFVCGVGTSPDDATARTRIATTTPEATLGAVVDFLRSAAAATPFTAIGVASFGPVELRPLHPAYGYITATPKAGWSHTDLLGPLGAFGVPIGFDTDVNGAALGEGRWGAAAGLQTYVYITIGTGIGGGAIVNGRVAHGLVHPEMGHIVVPRLAGDGFRGTCPYHGDCLEGMASGPALQARFGQRAEELDANDRAAAAEVVAHYLAAGIRTLVYALAPQRFVIGGGVAELPGLFPHTRARLAEQLGGYPGLEEHGRDDFVVPARLGSDAGFAGALVLAELAARS